MVFTEGGIATHALPPSGTLAVGRSEKADIRIEDASVSRNHLSLHLGGPQPMVEDLGSANGTRVRATPLVPHEPTPVSPGEMIEVGAVLVMLGTRALVPGRHRRIWPHEYFEGRLEDECARAERAGATFALLRIRCDSGEAHGDLQQVLAEAVRPPDVLGSYGPAEYEVLAVGVTPAQAKHIADRLAADLTKRGFNAVFGLACYPDDGRDPDSLIAQATTAATGAIGALDAAGNHTVDGVSMQSLRRLIERVAVSDISVLILGETGSGKEVTAETLHNLSPRAGKPFLRLSCAALSESLLESELFGHERGAFTGAVQAKPGLLETAQGGTVLLDEIGELPLTLQVKLLRVLEERKVLRVGSLTPRAIDVRFLAATNRDLEALIERGWFRQDLFYRLNGVTLFVPPLRERPSEIEPLARTFLRAACQRAGSDKVPELSPETLSALQRYSWPGNIRELRNMMERASLLCTDGVVTLEHLPLRKMRSTYVIPSTPGGNPDRRHHAGPEPLLGDGRRRPASDSGATPPLPPRLGPLPPAREVDVSSPLDQHPSGARPAAPPPASPPTAVACPADRDQAERQRILDALNACAGNQTRAAETLGIARRTLINRLVALGIPRPRKNKDEP